MHGLEQLHERTLAVGLRKLVPAIQVHDLTEQRDFLHTTPNEFTHLAHNLFDRAAALGAARLRHNAEGAMHVAALHDGNESGRLARV